MADVGQQVVLRREKLGNGPDERVPYLLLQVAGWFVWCCFVFWEEKKQKKAKNNKTQVCREKEEEEEEGEEREREEDSRRDVREGYFPFHGRWNNKICRVRMK